MLENKSNTGDLVISFIIAIVYYFSMLLIFQNNQPFSYFGTPTVISLFINVLVTVLGVLAVIITLFTVFEEIYKTNPAIKILKARGQYIQLFERYTDSIFAIFFSIVLLTIIYIFVSATIQNPLDDKINLVFHGATFLVVTLSFLRIYRSFILFKFLQEAIQTSKKEP